MYTTADKGYSAAMMYNSEPPVCPPDQTVIFHTDPATFETVYECGVNIAPPANQPPAIDHAKPELMQADPAPLVLPAPTPTPAEIPAVVTFSPHAGRFIIAL